MVKWYTVNVILFHHTVIVTNVTVRLQVIAPEEIIDPKVDEQSVMTYLSQFPKAKLKPGAPLKPKLNPKKARAYGPGRTIITD